MASYQRVALYLLFDSIEQDLVRQIRILVGDKIELTADEYEKAHRRILSRQDSHYDADAQLDLLQGLDIAEKYQILLRHSSFMPDSEKTYFSKISKDFQNIVPVRNSVMHARPLTIEEYSRGFAFAHQLLRSRSIWQILADNYHAFSKDPAAFTSRSIEFLEDHGNPEALHNLPTPEHDDTGFLPRPELERELKKRILGRHPVITILGEGGNGKTALALQTLYGLVSSNDHPFEAIIWVSAKTSMLTVNGIERIGNEVVSALSLIESAAEFEPGNLDPLTRLKSLLYNNKILLCIDNLETVQGNELKELAQDVPGESKLLITSRIPLGSDLSVSVGELSDKDAITFCRRLFEAYEVKTLKNRDNSGLLRYLKRLNNKPLLIKWFVLGLKSGLSADSIIADPKVALKFCLENVVERLDANAQLCLTAFATISAPISAQVLEYVVNLKAQDVELALSNLARFGLVDLVSSAASEQLYQLRPFARAYAIRVISPNIETSNEIRGNYSRIEQKFQSARALSSYNPYSLKNFKIESHSEMLASVKLNKSVHFAMNGDFESAYEIISQLRISDPAYFEVYRTQGYIAFLQGDALTASTAYESAIELAPNEPQLHFFYGCMLMRGLDNVAAAEHFSKAMAIDNSSPQLYREAARNAFVTGDFDTAEKMLDRAGSFDSRSHKDKVVLTDLRIQLYVRKLNHRVQATDWSSALETVRELAYFVYGLNISIFDERMINHLLNCQSSLNKIVESSNISSPLTEDLCNWIRSKFSAGERRRTATQSVGGYGAATGMLKREGVQSTFGFLRADDGRETFLHESDTGERLWQMLLGGARVKYEVFDDGTGRTRARNLSII